MLDQEPQESLENVWSRSSGSSHVGAARALLIEMDMKKTISRAAKQAIDEQIGALPFLAEFREVSQAFFNKYIGWDALKDDLAKIYADMFTEEELVDMIGFYQTPTGKKLANLAPELASKTFQLGQLKVQEHIEELQNQIMNAYQTEQGDDQESSSPPRDFRP